MEPFRQKRFFWHHEAPLFLRVYFYFFYMYCIYTFRYMRGHVTEKKNTVSVQGFPPEIYTILIFYLKSLSTKNNVATIMKTFSS